MRATPAGRRPEPAGMPRKGAGQGGTSTGCIRAPASWSAVLRRFGRSHRRALRQIEGTRPRSAGRLLSRAKCRPTKLGRNRDGASGGNCTYVSNNGSLLIRDACEACCLGLSETCREDLAFRKLVAAWPVLSPAVNE